ncbi:hypothetical protein [Sphingomicrobium arenosum]|uniref:hypothetical protein n=1 Tax=Sphingomicrobium arenosum TaxID=2233861 RepID=UPI002240EF37|nr:hypothetical protein [Sphingomicrobium arenosum]
MTETIVTSNDTAAAPTTPWHLWVVGILSLLWNGFGGYDYVMSQTRNMEYLGGMAPSPEAARELVAMLEAFPAWMEFFWALGVWGAIAGSVLLLMRNRFAVHAFAVSLLGMVVGMVYQMTMTNAPEWTTEGALAIFPWVIMLIGVLLLAYAISMRRKGWLR